MSNVLERIVDSTRRDVEQRRAEVPLAELERALPGHGDDRPFAEALVQPGISVIAEHTRRSPSAGAIRDGATVEEVVRAYERAGAAALSVLTEPHHFGGSLDDLRAAKAAVGLPILRKDFIVDPYQIIHSRALGADCILLIVAALSLAQLKEFESVALELGMDVLVEVHDRSELETALQLQTSLVGINNRNLRNFETSLQNTLDLLPLIPEGKRVVTESGILTPDDVKLMRNNEVHAFLVGEAFMRAEDPGAALHEMFFA